MGVFQAIDESASQAAHAGEEYVRVSKAYYKLKIFQQLALGASSILKMALYGSLFLLGLVFMAIAGASYLGVLLGSMALGYLCVGLFFFVLVGICYLGRQALDRKVIQNLSKTFFE